LNQAFQFQFKKSVYLGGLRWFCALVCSMGCALSAYYLFGLYVSLLTLLVGFALAAWPLSVEKSFYDAKTLQFLYPQRRNDATAPLFTVDGQSADLTAVWSCPMFSVLAASLAPDTVNQAKSKPKHSTTIRLLLGRDAMTDEQWHQFQVWRVWRQRG
jgi:hypothetical protein